MLRRKGAELDKGDVRLARQQIRVLAAKQVREKLAQDGRMLGGSAARGRARGSRRGSDVDDADDAGGGMTSEEIESKKLELARQFASGNLSKTQYMQGERRLQGKREEGTGASGLVSRDTHFYTHTHKPDAPDTLTHTYTHLHTLTHTRLGHRVRD